ncbi:hypothetical protein DH2020_038531 [Rehmannia glutinosa]|uniref:GDSL esterase/lipase n=1 Tax=Rehmannia glutinosa TaxID=99300 RepID=A0ABR0V0H5_REHGL
MAISNISFTIFTFIFILLPSNHASSSPLSPFKKIYAFGDSYTDTGNTRTSTGPTAFNYVSNHPYGVTFFHHPTNRYSDGRIVIDFVAEALSLPLLPPYRNPKADQSHGVDFAVGGATAIRHGFFLKNNVTFNLVPQSLQTQLVCLGSSLSSKIIQDLAINSVAGFLQALLNKGAKYIVVQGLPPTGCIPYSFSLSSPDDRDQMGCVASMNRITSAHNAALQTRLNALRKRNPQSVIVYADYYNAHLTLLKNANKYGFKEQYKVCCGYGGGPYNFDVFNTCGSGASTSCAKPVEYVNWDGAHLTEAAYRVITNSFLNGTFCSPSFRYLLAKKVQMG